MTLVVVWYDLLHLRPGQACIYSILFGNQHVQLAVLVARVTQGLLCVSMSVLQQHMASVTRFTV